MSDLSETNSTAIAGYNFNPVVNYLKPNSFRFQINRAPNVTYTCQSINLPSVQLGAAMQNTPFVDIPHPGDKVVFGEFNIRFLINEDMSNYLELFNWLKEIGSPYSGSDYDRALANRSSVFGNQNYNKVFSDGTLLILDSNNQPTTILSFEDMFPINVEALDFDVTTAGMEYFVGTASFRYKVFRIRSLINT